MTNKLWVLIEIVLKKISKLKAGIFLSHFSIISRKVERHIEDKSIKLDVCNKLAEGVAYTYGMDVKGDIAEFGTMTAATAVALATAVNSMEKKYRNIPSISNKKLYLFDSFEGLPKARFKIDQESPHVIKGIWGEGTCKGYNPSELNRILCKFLNPSRFIIIKGWFKDTLPTLENPSFSLIHIDGDLYESAIDVLDNLFLKRSISCGAIIYFDDFNCNASNPDFGERRAWSEVVEKYNVKYSDAGSYGIASHKFIIHSYE